MSKIGLIAFAAVIAVAGTSYAAEKITLVCSGTATVFSSGSTSGEGPDSFVIDLDRRTVSWGSDSYPIVGITTNSIEFKELTTAFARDAATYGVPDAIIGKMVQTEPGGMSWLTPADLQPMNVVVLRRSPRQSTPFTRR
jgi:hypothetical protein